MNNKRSLMGILELVIDIVRREYRFLPLLGNMVWGPEFQSEGFVLAVLFL